VVRGQVPAGIVATAPAQWVDRASLVSWLIPFHVDRLVDDFIIFVSNPSQMTDGTKVGHVGAAKHRCASALARALRWVAIVTCVVLGKNVCHVLLPSARIASLHTVAP